MSLSFRFLLSIACLSLAQDENIDCEKSGSCIYQQLNPSRINKTGHILCDGLGSCFGSTIINNNLDSTTACHGKRSCQNLVSLSGTTIYPADVRGYLGLAWTEKIENITTVIGCGSEAACYGIKRITGAKLMTIGGHMGSASINVINNVQMIVANASFSLKDSVVRITNSTSTGTVDNSSQVFVAWMFGFYSGYNATIYCESGQHCSIICQTNGCENLNFICDVTSGNNYCSVSCNNSDGIICPNGWQNGMNNYNYSYNYSGTRLGYLWLLNNLSNITFGLEDYFNITRLDNHYISYENVTQFASDIVEYFDYECRNINANVEFSMCGDAEQCRGQTIEYTNGNTNICCSGVSGCRSSDIWLNSNYESNIRNNFNNTNKTNTTTTATIRHNLYCDGDKACRDATIVLFNSNYNDYTDNIYCRGRLSCFYGISINNFDKVICSGKKACHSYAVIGNGNVLACLGGSSCNGASIINVRTVIATGSFSLCGSQIINNGRDLDIYLLGYQSSDGLTIICQTGTSCTVYCMNINVCNATIKFSCSSQVEICNKEFVSLDPVYYNYSHYDTDNNNNLPNPTSLPTSMTTSIPTGIPSSITTLNPTTVASLLPSYAAFLPTNVLTYMPDSSSTSVSSDTPSSQPTKLPSDFNSTIESIFTTSINVNTTQNKVNSDDDDGVGDINIIIGNEDTAGDDRLNSSIITPNTTLFVYSNSSQLRSKLEITFTILLDSINTQSHSFDMNSKNNTSITTTSNTSEHKLLIHEKLEFLSTKITSLFGKYFDDAVGFVNNIYNSSEDDNKTAHEIYINTTIELVEDNTANTPSRRILQSEMNDTSTSTSVQVDTIIIIENEVIDTANSSYFDNIGNVFYLILNATNDIFNVTDATIDYITIFVTIIPVPEENQSDKTSDDNDDDVGDEEVDNGGFWTPELIAVLVMIGVGLCVVSCVLFCCISFCCKKSQQLSKDGVLAQKHLSHSEDERATDDSSRMRVKSASQHDQHEYTD